MKPTIGYYQSLPEVRERRELQRDQARREWQAYLADIDDMGVEKAMDLWARLIRGQVAA